MVFAQSRLGLGLPIGAQWRVESAARVRGSLPQAYRLQRQRLAFVFLLQLWQPRLLFFAGTPLPLAK